MDIVYYREFIELASCLNFHEAAKSLNMSQSSLSKHILSLEGHYGVQLLDRSKKRVSLTEEGTVFFEQALRIWEDYEESIKVMRSQTKMSCLRLTGIVDSPDEYRNMSRILAHMQAQGNHRITTIACQTLSPRHLANLVTSGEVDCAMSYFAPSAFSDGSEIGRLAFAPVCSFPIDAVVSRRSALASKDALDPADMAGASFVHLVGPYFTPLWNQIEEKLAGFGIPYTTKPYATNNVYDYANLDLSDRILLMPRREGVIGICSNPNYKVIPINNREFTLDVAALYLVDNDNPSLPVFIEAARDCYLS